ncbi:MAG: hypothetical protein ACLPOA_00045 [Methylocella sp.]
MALVAVWVCALIVQIIYVVILAFMKLKETTKELIEEGERINQEKGVYHDKD